MIQDSAVTCTLCGASTPLPNDLRVPTFPCNFCHGTLETAVYAGQSATSADALMGHIREAVGNAQSPRDVARTVPRFKGGDSSHRPANCRKCGAAIAVPLDLEINTVRCEGCQRSQPVSDYISDRERLDLDMARQVAGNEALKKLLAEGVHCGKCGGHNSVPDDGSVQVVCRFCGAAILLSDFVDETAIARRRLKHKIFSFKDEMIAQQEARDRRLKWMILGGIAAAFLLIAVAMGISVIWGLLQAAR